MSFAVLSARYANEQHSAAVIRTAEAGDVVISERDTPELWALLPADVEAYSVPTVVPSEVTKRQALQVLILHDLDEQVDALLAAMPGKAGKLARAEWEQARTVERERPLTLQMIAALGLSQAQADALFAEAGQLP